MAAIFRVFYNADIPLLSTFGKMETQTLEVSVILIFSVWFIFKKLQPFFDFCIMANADIPFLSTLRKLEAQTLGGSVIWNFYIWLIFMKR